MEQVGLKFVADGAGGFVAAVDAGSRAARLFGIEVEKTEKKSTSAFDAIARGAQERIGHMLVNSLQAAGQAVIGFVKDGVKGAADFQSSMAMFETSASATTEEMQKARETAKALGADLTLPSTSASDAGAAMTELAKAGLTAKESMDAARGALQLAAAGNLGNAEAATIAAQALNAFSLDGTQATQVADMLAAAANASALEVRDVAEGFKMASSVFSSFQGPVVGNADAMYDLTTALSIMANAGIAGSDAGTSLKQTLLQLSGPTDKAKKLMVELAQNVGLSGNLAYDAEGKMRSFRDIIDITKQATAGMTQEQRNFTITTIFGSDAMRSMITLMGAGAEGWDEMRSKITAQNSAASLAGVRMTGLNGIIAGLGSQVETLALEAFTPLLPLLEEVGTAASTLVSSLIPLAGPAVTSVVQTLTSMGSIAETTGHIISNGLVPAIYAASTALGIYALINLPAVISALPILIGLLLGSASAFAAQAVAAAAAAIPIIAIGVAIAGVAVAWSYYQDQVDAVTQKVLNNNEAWRAGTDVLNEYHQSSDLIQTTFRDQAAHLEELRAKQTEQVAAYASYVAMWGAGTAEAQRQRDAINELGIAITDETTKLQSNIDTYKGLHETDAIEDLRLIRVGFGETATSIQLAKEEAEKWQKAAEDASKGALTALSDYVTQAAGLLTALGDTNKSLQDRITADQALAYAQQAAAQRAHLGEMLTDYTIAWGRMNGVSEETIMKIVGQIEDQFGVASDLTGTAMLQMEGHIREAMTGSSEAVNGLSQRLGSTADAAVDMKMKADALEKKYVMELVENFKEGKMDADEFLHTLEKIPPRVTTEVRTNFTYSGERASNPLTPRAGGGPVHPSQVYLVGEQGPELFIPSTSGKILDARRTSSMSRAEGGAQIGDLDEYFLDLGASAASNFLLGFESMRGEIEGGVSQLAEEVGRQIQSFSTDSISSMGDEVDQWLEKWGERMEELVKGLEDQLSSAVGALEGGLEGRQSGGPVRRGTPYIVGEGGSELFVPSSSGTVVGTSSTREILNQLSQSSIGRTSQPIVNVSVPPPQVVLVQPSASNTYYGQVGDTYNQPPSRSGGTDASTPWSL